MSMIEKLFGQSIRLSDAAVKKQQEELTPKHIEKTFQEDAKNG